MEVVRREREERRKKSRFPISSELRYKLVEGDAVLARGAGETIDIGSGGVSFVAEQRLKPGTFIELSISWPMLLEENTRIRLVVFGRLLRSTSHVAACTVDKYEFRTQARSMDAAAEVRQDSMLERWVGEAQKEPLKGREKAFSCFNGGQRIPRDGQPLAGRVSNSPHFLVEFRPLRERTK